MAKWITVEDRNIEHFWKCEEENCSEDNMGASVGPDWYHENGTPICGCGCDMHYQETRVRI